jgi:hypothetical protein
VGFEVRFDWDEVFEDEIPVEDHVGGQADADPGGRTRVDHSLAALPLPQQTRWTGRSCDQACMRQKWSRMSGLAEIARTRRTLQRTAIRH